MGNSNKYADGLNYILFPGNLGFGAAGYNFPESTAQDDGGGAGNLSLSFSGSRLPGSTITAGQPLRGFYRGPSGFLARYTPLAMMTGATYQTFNSQVPYLAYPETPNLRVIYGVSHDNNVEIGSNRQDDGTFITERFKNTRAFNTVSQLGVLDLISEGPIEGLVSGVYTYTFDTKTTGDIGYSSASFSPYSIDNAPREARSIYWDDVPIVDFAGYYNFQFTDYKYTYGDKGNEHTIYNPYLNLYEERRDYFGRQVDRNKYPLQTCVTSQKGDNLYGYYLVSGSKYILNPKTYYVYNTDISSIKINIKINGLYENILTGINAGDVEKQNFNIRFYLYRVFKDGQVDLLNTSKYSPYTKDFYSKDQVSIFGKVANSPVVFTYEFAIRPYAENSPSFEILPNQIGWAVDVVKEVKESIGPGFSTSATVDSITEVYSDRFVYPDSALIYSKFDARYFSSVPSRSYKVRLLKVKVPVNYDPITKNYSGPWNGKFKIAWTDNPAWCFYDLIANNRFGIGRYINSDLIDKWTLYEIGQYCDQLVDDGGGGLEPRFSCNVYITTKQEAYKVLNDMASIFRGILYYSAGQISVAQDSKKDPIYSFNNSNILNGNFNYSDSSKKSRKTVAIVRYNDMKDNYKPAIEVVEQKDALMKYGIRETEISAFGCTSKNQARRLGKWLITTENFETEIIEFDAGIEGNFLKPGDVISVYDQNRRSLAYAGRTLELTTGYAILDLPYNYANTYPITGANVNNSLVFNVLTPTYNFNFGTQLGDLYATGYSAISSGVSGLNSSFLRKSQLQYVTIDNPKNYLTSGSGIYSNNIRINFPYITSIPENVTLPNTNMSVVGNKFTKLIPDSWTDAQAYSSIGYNKNMFVEATANATNKALMFGLNSDPTTDASYSSLDYAWYFTVGGLLQIWENNVQIITNLGSYTTSTKLRINYDGEWITYLKDNVVMRATPVKNKNQYFYFDSSFHSFGASINANYGTFALNDNLSPLPKNAIWSIDVSTTGYLEAGVNTQSKINNPLSTKYPGYYLESYLNKPTLYRIISISETDSNVFKINGLQYNPNKYDDIDKMKISLPDSYSRSTPPSSPTLSLSTLYRAADNVTDPAAYLVGGAGSTPYSTNQGGINSIMYNVQPSASAKSSDYYKVYLKYLNTFTSTAPEESYLIDTLSSQNIKSTIDYSVGFIHPFITPTGIGNYYFRAYAVNKIGELSTPTDSTINFATQANVFSVISSGRNLY